MWGARRIDNRRFVDAVLSTIIVVSLGRGHWIVQVFWLTVTWSLLYHAPTSRPCSRIERMMPKSAS